MATTLPLMQHATAAWLVDNSALTFPQIADFCGLHILEIQAIADDTAAIKLKGRDPIRAGELTREELDKGEANPDYEIKISRMPDHQHDDCRHPRQEPLELRESAAA